MKIRTGCSLLKEVFERCLSLRLNLKNLHRPIRPNSNYFICCTSSNIVIAQTHNLRS